MRYLPLDSFEPSPYATYFLHVQSAPDAQSVGLCLVGVGAAVPCKGADYDLTDGYDGHVYHEAGTPRAGALVRYFRDERLVAQTVTDANGRHRITLLPGHYQYQILTDVRLPLDLNQAVYAVTVSAAKRVRWEHAAETVTETNDSSANISAQNAPQNDSAPASYATEREVLFSIEYLIGDWNASDGVPIDWHDVQESVLAIARRLKACEGARLRLLSFSNFARPEMLHLFATNGLIVEDVRWGEAAFAMAFRNIGALMTQRALELRPYDEANRQLRGARLPTTGNRIEGVAGEALYLAQARAAAFHFASSLGVLHRGGAGSLGNYAPAATGALRLPAFLGQGATSKQFGAFGGKAPEKVPWREY